MDKHTALETLIRHSFTLSEKARKRLIKNITSFTDEEIYALGRYLALEKRNLLKANDALIESFAQIEAVLIEKEKDLNE